MYYLARLLIVATLLSAFCSAALQPASSQVPQLPESKPVEEGPARKISAQTTRGQDQAVERRLREIFSELEGANRVGVEVRSGVVTLTGQVSSQTTRKQAVEIARQLEGVVEVQDETTPVRGISGQIAPAFQRLRKLVSDLVVSLPLIVFAVAIFLVFWLLAFLLGKWHGLYGRFTNNALLADSLRQLIKLAVLAAGLVVAFELLDATALIGTVLGAAGLLGLALGFALRDTVENYIAGVLLSMRQPFVRNDWVEIEGQEGHVLRLTSRATIIMTLDGNHVRIPNAMVLNRIVINYTRNPVRRFHFDVGVSVDSNIVAAQDLAAKTLLAMEGVIEDPPPRVDLQALGDFNIILRAYGWVDQRRFDFLKVKSEATRLVKQAFDAAGIVMPEPIYTLRMQEPVPKAPAADQRESAGPKNAIDVQRRTEMEQQIAEDRRKSGALDLLQPGAPLE